MELWKVWFMIAQRVKEYKVEFSTSVTSGWSSRRSKVEIQFNRMIKDSSAKSDSDNDCEFILKTNSNLSERVIVSEWR